MNSPPKSLCLGGKFLAQFQNVLVVLLLIATFISAALWVYERESALPYEASAIFAVVMLIDPWRLVALRGRRQFCSLAARIEQKDLVTGHEFGTCAGPHAYWTRPVSYWTFRISIFDFRKIARWTGAFDLLSVRLMSRPRGIYQSIFMRRVC